MNKPTKVILAIVLLAIAAVSVYLAAVPRGANVDLSTYGVLGAVTAEETAKLLGNKGEVLLMSPDSGAYKNPSVEAQVKAFKNTLKPLGSFKLTVERVPITPMLMLATGGGVPADQFFKTLKAHPDAGAVVLFFRFPQLTDAEIEELKKCKARTVVVSSLYPDYQRLLDRQALHLAIVPRPEAAAAGNPKTVRERFDQEFMVVGAQARAQ